MLYFDQPQDKQLEYKYFIHLSFSVYISLTVLCWFGLKLGVDNRAGSRDCGPDKRRCLRYPSVDPNSSQIARLSTPFHLEPSVLYRVTSILY